MLRLFLHFFFLQTENFEKQSNDESRHFHTHLLENFLLRAEDACYIFILGASKARLGRCA